MLDIYIKYMSSIYVSLGINMCADVFAYTKRNLHHLYTHYNSKHSSGIVHDVKEIVRILIASQLQGTIYESKNFGSQLL